MFEEGGGGGGGGGGGEVSVIYIYIYVGKGDVVARVVRRARCFKIKKSSHLITMPPLLTTMTSLALTPPQTYAAPLQPTNMSLLPPTDSTTNFTMPSYYDITNHTIMTSPTPLVYTPL